VAIAARDTIAGGGPPEHNSYRSVELGAALHAAAAELVEALQRAAQVHQVLIGRAHV
jgi:hypothetical protein